MLFKIFQDLITMDGIEEHLFLANIETSCWKDQLKQAVSLCLLINAFHAIQSISS